MYYPGLTPEELFRVADSTAHLNPLEKALVAALKETLEEIENLKEETLEEIENLKEEYEE